MTKKHSEGGRPATSSTSSKGHQRAGTDISLSDERHLAAGPLGKDTDLLVDALQGKTTFDRGAATPIELAYDLVDQALIADTPAEAAQLAREALDASADCADAYLLLGELTSDPHEARAFFEDGIRAAERLRTTDGHENHPRELIDPPYARATEGLALTLWEIGERQQALHHLQGLLEIDPSDENGSRYVLLSWLLQTGDDLSASRLLARFPDDTAPDWAFSAALLEFRHGGPSERSASLLRQAIAHNAFVPLYLLGALSIPENHLEDLFDISDRHAAMDYAARNTDLWQSESGAMQWVAQVLTTMIEQAPALAS